MLFFYPLDFTFVCPTEIVAMSERAAEFHDSGRRDPGSEHRQRVLPPRVDQHASRSERAGASLNFPLGGDTTLEVSLVTTASSSRRRVSPCAACSSSIPEGVLRYSVVHDLNIGRSVDETLRVLQALQAGGLCPVNWKRGEKLLNP